MKDGNPKESKYIKTWPRSLEFFDQVLQPLNSLHFQATVDMALVLVAVALECQDQQVHKNLPRSLEFFHKVLQPFYSLHFQAAVDMALVLVAVAMECKDRQVVLAVSQP